MPVPTWQQSSPPTTSVAMSVSPTSAAGTDTWSMLHTMVAPGTRRDVRRRACRDAQAGIFLPGLSQTLFQRGDRTDNRAAREASAT